jgi:hypothetical protein
VAFALKGLWSDARLRRKRNETVSLIVPDQAVRMAVVPLEGQRPRASEGEAMARWALRDLFPLDDEQCRVDWTVLSNDSTPGERNWLFALAAAVDVVREYEEIVEGLGLTVGRVVPMSLALAAAVGRPLVSGPTAARIVLCEAGGLLSGLVEADGVPRLHRAWRRIPGDLEAELRAIDRYLQQRQGLTIAEAAVAGPRRWRAEATRACEALGWQTTPVSRWKAHRGAC